MSGGLRPWARAESDPDEDALLAAAAVDDVSFDLGLINLGLRENPAATTDPPSVEVVNRAFAIHGRVG